MGIIMAVVFLALFLVPFLDRRPEHGWRQRKVAVTVLGLVALFMLVVSVYVWINNAQGH